MATAKRPGVYIALAPRYRVVGPCRRKPRPRGWSRGRGFALLASPARR